MKLYTTFIAHNMMVEELLKFLKDFSALESTSFTTTFITWSETSPRLCTIALHVEKEQDSLLRASFETGLLHHWGWGRCFELQALPTTSEMLMMDEFREPKILSQV